MTRSYKAVMRLGVALLIAFIAAAGPLSHATAGDDGPCCVIFNEGEGSEGGNPTVIFGMQAGGIAAFNGAHSSSIHCDGGYCRE